jgi:hypothetical protein
LWSLRSEIIKQERRFISSGAPISGERTISCDPLRQVRRKKTLS